MGNGQESVVKFFTQCPNLILYGLPDVAIQDKWALLALVGICWDRSKGNRTLRELEGPYKLSLREIASLTGVKHTHLRKTEGKDPRNGTLDRLQEIGYVTVIDAKPIDRATGKLGRTQTYLYIHLEKMWKDNVRFAEVCQMPAKLVREDSFARVVDGETVTVGDSDECPDEPTVTHGNTIVTTGNRSVTHGNNLVTDVSVKSDPIRRPFSNTREDIEPFSSKRKLTRVPTYVQQGIRDITRVHGGSEQSADYEAQAFDWYQRARDTMDGGKAREIFEGAIASGKSQGIEHFFAHLRKELKHLEKV